MVRAIDGSELMLEIQACSWDSDQDRERAGEHVYKLPDHHNAFGEAWWIDGDVPVENISCVFSADKDA